MFENPDTRSYWQAAQAGKLMVQKCAACKACFAYPRPYCIKCFSDDVSLVQSEGRGTIYARTVVRMLTAPADKTGQTIVLVDLNEGVRLLARFDGASPEMGQAVTLHWDLSADKAALVARPGKGPLVTVILPTP